MVGVFGIVSLGVVGGLILRPHDVPVVARNAGRAAGLMMRALRQGKEMAENFIEESRKSADGDADLKHIREQVGQSFSEFDDLATKVRRDFAEVPLSAAEYLRRARYQSRIDNISQKSEAATGTTTASQVAPAASVPDPTAGLGAATAPPPPSKSGVTTQSDTYAHSRTHAPSSGAPPAMSAGVDFIARSIEEGALAERERQMFGHDEPGPPSPRSSR